MNYSALIYIHKIENILNMENSFVLILLPIKQNFVQEEVKTFIKKIIMKGKHAFIIIMRWIKEGLILKIIAMNYAQPKNVKKPIVSFPTTKLNRFTIQKDTKVNFVKHTIIKISDASIKNSVLLLTIKQKLKLKLFISKLEIKISLCINTKQSGAQILSIMIVQLVFMHIIFKTLEEIHFNLNIKYIISYLV